MLDEDAVWSHVVGNYIKFRQLCQEYLAPLCCMKGHGTVGSSALCAHISIRILDFSTTKFCSHVSTHPPISHSHEVLDFTRVCQNCSSTSSLIGRVNIR